MAELSTIARPYAEAIFEVAGTDGAGLGAWADTLQEMAQVVGHPEVQAVLADPHLDAAARANLVRGLLKSTPSPKAVNFLSMLAENDRMLLLPEIAAQFVQLKNRQEGSADALIETAYELTGAQLAELVAGLEKKFNIKLKPDVRVDASLIGGVRVVVGDQVLDTSVRAQLERMRDTLVAH
ncbi:MAG: F0F1 ATP synthase subunit delta [Pigmentiphaga sp.]|nr:F0F1 ATP synthase subunit delta [Pigmentiphaga sp.]